MPARPSPPGVAMYEAPHPYHPEIGLRTSGMPIRILIVEGSDYAGGLLRETGSPSLFHIECTRDARQAIHRLRNEFYEAVVVELPHPGVSAEQIFRSVIAFDLEQALRMVFIANDLSDPDTRHFLTQAGRPFLTRPVDPTELHDLVMRVAVGPKGEPDQL